MPRARPRHPHPAPWGAGLATALALIATASGCGEGDATTSTTAGAPPAAAEPGGTDRSPAEPDVGDGRGGVELREIGNFEQPVYVTQPPAGDESLYVVEQTGRVERVPAEGGEPEVFLDLSGEVSCCGEQGLLSIAFAPDYERSGLLYASYTNAEGDSRVIEYARSQDGEAADAASAREVLAIDQPYPNHNGGLVAFGPDGLLYAGFGDGGSGGDPQRHAQDPGTLLGKLVRIDPRARDHGPYGIPESNAAGAPSVDAVSEEAPLLYALGLRNPWRFSFDRKTGDLWIGDVGQSELEEVDGVERPRGDAPREVFNFGWSAYEGTERYNPDERAPGAIDPVLTYGRDRGCSITGGFVVRDRRLESLYGRYLYGDYCEGELRSFTARPGSPARDDAAVGVQVPALSSFGEDASGQIYATSLEGPVYRLDPTH